MRILRFLKDLPFFCRVEKESIGKVGIKKSQGLNMAVS